MDTSDKLLTVIVPSYNMEDYLGKCLDSLILKREDGSLDDALMDALEVLVINDGSKDRTSEIGHGYQDRFPGTFRVIDKVNGHYGSCVNRGLDEATGTFIRVLDADDYVIPDRFRGFMKALISFEPSHLPDAVMTDYEYVNADGAVRRKCQFSHFPAKTFFSFENIGNITREILQNHNLTYRTAIPRSIGYRQTEGVLYTDAEWYILPMTQVETTYYYPEAVVQYLVGREGQSITPEVRARNVKTLWDIALGIVKRMEELSPTAKPSGLKFAQERTLQFLANRYHKQLLPTQPLPGGLKKQLIQFDRTLSQISPFFYERVAANAVTERHVFQLHYIQEWRKRHSTFTVKFLLFKFFRFFSPRFHKIRKLLFGK
jgi:glycosyltransferase involved in cell wall biosynthesis